MKNTESNFVRMIKEICEEEAIQIKSFSSDWVFCLEKDGVYNYIAGYQFGINSGSVHAVCCDKSAASEIMASFGIPCVEHFYFMSPENQKYIGADGSWLRMTDLLEQYGKLVCKPNEGTGGNLVYCVDSQLKLEHAVFEIFKKSSSVAVSPYYEIENEYRAVVLNGEIKLVYAKQRPYVVGDGTQNAGSLVYHAIAEGTLVKPEEMDGKGMEIVPDKDEIYYLNWKHNLGKGACAVIEGTGKALNEIRGIVSELVTKINIAFASVDIIKCRDGYKVLEVNSGVMMEHFSRQDENTYQIAKEIYREAVCCMMQKT